jgi:hypothetical protein
MAGAGDMPLGIGIGFLFGFLNVFIEWVDKWIGQALMVNILPKTEYPIILINEYYGFSQIIFTLLLAATALSLIYTIETRFMQRKIPFISYALLLGCVLLVVGIHWIPMLGVGLVLIFGATIVGVLNVVMLYGRAAWESSGVIRYRMIAIPLGLLLVVLFSIDFGGWSLPHEVEAVERIIEKGIAILGLFLIYWGMHLKIHK